MIEEREYWYWLLNIEGITNITLDKLFETYDSPEEIFCSNVPEILAGKQKENFIESKKRFDKYRRDYELLAKKDVRMILPGDEDFPERLVGIPEKSYGIFVRGELPESKEKTVAMIGARRATQHGKWMASHLAKDIAEKGIGVISGLAEGIDGSSHIGALEGNGKTYAVLGCGVDICFPRTHEGLYRRILEKGGIISEYGLGMPGLSYHFPKRNRIISALSDLVIVVEARERSGSLITVSCALSQGREVMAVPGRPDDLTSESCNRLIKEGAGCCTCVQDVLDGLLILNSHNKKNSRGKTPKKISKIAKSKTRGSEGTSYIDLNENERKIVEALSGEPVHQDEISRLTNIEFGELVICLMELEIRGIITSISPGIYRRN